MVDFPLRSVDKEVHQLKLITIITERGGVGGCSRNLCNPHSNLSGMFTGILQEPRTLFFFNGNLKNPHGRPNTFSNERQSVVVVSCL